jgi:hypothetical protein
MLQSPPTVTDEHVENPKEFIAPVNPNVCGVSNTLLHMPQLSMHLHEETCNVTFVTSLSDSNKRLYNRVIANVQNLI